MDDILRVALHSERLASACRSVDKYGAVLAVEERVAEGVALDLLVDVALSGLGVEHFLETVDLLLEAAAFGGLRSPDTLSHHDLRFVPIND